MKGFTIYGPSNLTDKLVFINKRNISLKFWSKYLQLFGSKCHFSVFSIKSQWKL